MNQVICSQCHHLGRPAKKKRGSSKVEFMLWMSFPLGIPYTLWRMATKYPACAKCGSQLLIPADSVIGRRLLAKSLEAMAPMMAQAYREEMVENEILGAPRAMTLAPRPMHEEFQDVIASVALQAQSHPRSAPKPDEW